MSAPGVMTACWATFKREILLSIRNSSEFLNPVFFCFLVALMFPLGLGPSPKTLSMLAPGLIWIIALLACLYATDGMFQQDFDDGSLALLMLSPQPHYFLIMSRLLAKWFVCGLLVSLVSPVLGLMLSIPVEAVGALIISLILGSVCLIFIGAIGAALTVGVRNSGVLLTIIILPQYVPVLIFGSAAVQAAAQGMPIDQYIAILGAIMVLSLTLSPLAVVAALKVNMDAS